MALQDEIRRVINERLLPLNWTIQDLIDKQNLLTKANGKPYTLNTIQTLPYNRSNSLPDLDLGLGNHVNNGQSVLFYRVDITADGQLIFALPEHVNQEEHLTHLGNLTNMLLIMKFNETVIKRLRQAETIVFFTGAGISQESGIPTFRDGAKSLWKDFDPDIYASVNGFDNDPSKVWQWYAERRQQVRVLEPNRAHFIIADWQHKAPHVTVITQNIDGFHQRAGSQNVIELHGSIARNQCRKNGHRFPHDFDHPTQQPPNCPECNSLLRPDVVWFGENLPEEAYSQAEMKSFNCDVLVSIGCSMEVFPAASLPYNAARCGAYLIQINTQATDLDTVAECNFQGKASEVLSALWCAVWNSDVEA